MLSVRSPLLSVFIVLSVIFAACNSTSARGEAVLRSRPGTMNDAFSPRPKPDVGLDLRYAPVQQSSGQTLVLALEWLPLTRFGKLGIGTEIGYFSAFNQADSSDKDYNIPLNARVSYRFDYFSDQFLVPFVTGTTNMTYLRPSQVTMNTPGLAYPQNLTYRYTIGAQLRLDNADHQTSQALYRNFGVKNSYLSLEYGLNDQTFRFGLRFEI